MPPLESKTRSLRSKYRQIVSKEYVYRMGLQEGKFELATAVGLFKSVINFALVVIANKTARMAGEEGIY